MNQIIEQMKSLGLTEYEGKAYLTLLETYPVNGYTLSKISGIPRSRIYEVLDGLKKKQIVFEKHMDKSVLYTPLEPKLLVKKLKQNFDVTIESVDQYTNQLFNESNVDIEPKRLSGRDDILEMIKILIKEAKHRIALSIWDEELQVLKTSLDVVIQKGVLIRGIYFGENNPYDEMVSHRRMDRYKAENQERYIIVVIDGMHVFSGMISRGETAQVTWSRDRGIIQISDDFIAHDVMLNTYSNILTGHDRAVYERSLDQVRKAYHCFSDDAFELFPIPEVEKDME